MENSGDTKFTLVQGVVSALMSADCEVNQLLFVKSLQKKIRKSFPLGIRTYVLVNEGDGSTL